MLFRSSSGSSVTSSEILSPLSPYSNKISVCKGIDLDSSGGSNKPGGPHATAAAAMLSGGWLLPGNFTGAGCPCGYGNRITLDQELAKYDEFSKNTAFKSLEFGLNIRGQEPLRYMSYRASGEPNPAVDNPWRMFKRVFGNFTGEKTTTTIDLSEKSVLDYISNELNTLKNRLPSDDLPRLEAHLTHIRDIEKQMTTLARQTCTVSDIGSEKKFADELFPQFAKIQLDLMFQAHACDLTRVSTFMWSNANSWQRFPWLGFNDQHHDISHVKSNADTDKLTKINKWYTEQLGYFLGLLNSVKEGDKTMLDNSVVLSGAGIGEGNHTLKDIPWLIAGSASNKLNSGKVYDFNGIPHNNLLLTILHAFGKTDKKTFGAPENCTGTIPQLLKV